MSHTQECVSPYYTEPFCPCIHRMRVQMHMGLDMHVCNHHFRLAVAVAVAFLSKGPLIMDVRSPAWAVWLLSSCCHEGQSIYSCPLPESQQREQRAYSVTRERRGGENKRMCACMEMRVHELQVRRNSLRYVCVNAFLSVCVCVYVRLPCASSMWHPLTQGKNPPDMKPLFSVNPCSAQRARFMLGSLETSNMRLGCLVTDSLGAFCPWFDSWEPGSVLTCESRVSGVSRFVMSNPL